MTSDDLIDQYYAFAQEGDTLIPFVSRTLSGAFGQPDRVALLHFLDRIESIILGNIVLRFEEGPGLDADPDTVSESARQEIDEARSLVMIALGTET
ncbi:MAG: hypothetical protein C7B45_08485 [Sulfobacillus acidophilus]|uniref:Uncharacterized protein n=1 Tax=Sulfobacillus acidophilus TaxID=53633 RepID=A0A2T2WIF4_9FIRM|nr:MAG: hypothetical protein C7B45_08485 [Sulfobacillus acidophilus]